MVSVHGRLTVGSPAERALGLEIKKLLDLGLRRFVLDLEYTGRIDSSGIGEMAAVHLLVKEYGGELSIRDYGKMDDVLMITKLFS